MFRNRPATAVLARNLRRVIVAPACLVLLSGCVFAQRSAGYVNTATVKTASAKIAVAAALTPPLPGSLPMYTDTSGTLGNSVVFQSGSNVGIGTASPTTTLNLVGANPTMRIDNYSNNLGDSPNFNFLSARGVAGAPLPTVNGDNLGQFAAAGFNGSAFPSSKVKVSFLATENWTTSANGTAMLFMTTKNGTTSRGERMRIDNTGNVGIGVTAPAFPLSVGGIVQSTSGGFKFPDGSTQTTAATTGVLSVAPADSSISVTGTATAPTLAVNTATIQKRVNGTCPAGQAVSTVNVDGSVSCVAAGTSGGSGAPVVKDAKGNVLGTLVSIGGANATDVTIYTKGYFVTVGITGEFPVGYIAAGVGVPSPGASSSLPNQAIGWTGTNCTGSAVLIANTSSAPLHFPTTYAKNVVYSAQLNQLMVPVGTGATATAIGGTVFSFEFAGNWVSGASPTFDSYADGVSLCAPLAGGGSGSGWLLETINPATTLGWAVSGTPLSVAGPLQLP